MTYNSREVGVFHCDECPEAIETEEDTFTSAWAAARAKGWRSFKGPDKQWAHVCPACVGDWARRGQ